MFSTESHNQSSSRPDPRTHGFARREWFDMLARHCFPEKEIFWPDARLGNDSATLPLIRDGRELSSLSNYYSFSYAPIYGGAPSPERRRRLIASIAGGLRPQFSCISFYPLLDEEQEASAMRAAFASAGWIAMLTNMNSNHYLDIDGRDFATYWAARPGELRSGVRRKSRAHPYDYEITDRLSDGLWADYESVYAASWKKAEPFPNMVRAIAEEAEARGVLRLGFARAAGAPVATQLWTIEGGTGEGGTACLHKLAHDSAQGHHSPGTLLSHHMFAHMIDHEKVRRIDYGTGDNAYKRDWMEQERPMFRLDCFNPKRPEMWARALRTRISQLAGRPRSV